MTLYWFLLVVSALGLGSMPAQSVPLYQCLGPSLALILAWVVLVQMVASGTRRAVVHGLDPLIAVRALERQLDLFRWLGLVVSATCLVGFGLAATVQTWPLFAHSMTLQALMLLSPSLMITAAVWIAEHRYGVAMGYTERHGLQVVKDMFSAMVATGGWIVVPVLTMLAATDLIRASGLLNQQAAATAISFLTLFGIPFMLPIILRRVWKTSPASESDCAWFEPLLVSARINNLPVRRWHTDMKIYNAVVAGFFPGLRSLIVSDRLLDEMPRRDLAMVMLHEIAHVRRGHVWFRVLAMGPSWLVASVVSSFMNASPVASVITNLIAVMLTLLTLRWVAHSTEYDADRVACQMSLALPASYDPPKSKQQAADRYCLALRWVTRQETNHDKATWLHPSTDARCSNLQRWAAQQERYGFDPEITVQSNRASCESA